MPRPLLTIFRQPKSAKPKPVTQKATTNGTTSTRGGIRGRGRGRGGRGGRNTNRPKPKTADELDAEMVDYFDTTATGAAAPAEGAAATGGDELGMEEISVSSPRSSQPHIRLTGHSKSHISDQDALWGIEEHCSDGRKWSAWLACNGGF